MKLLPFTTIEHHWRDNVVCDHCGRYLNETENIAINDPIAWCIDCCRADFQLLSNAIKTIDPKFKAFDETYGEGKIYRYHWWVGSEYKKEIGAVPKKGVIVPNKIVMIGDSK